MKTYCITGVSGYIGGLLARRLADVTGNRVIGIDLKAPTNPGKMIFHQKDIRDPEISDILATEKVDVFIHLAFYTMPEGDPEIAQSVNIEGTQNILQAIGQARVGRVVLASSSAAYGSHPDNPVPLCETTPLRANDFFYYSAHKARQEEMMQDFLSTHPEVKAVILRPCVLIGPHINNPTGESFKEKILLFIRGEQTPIQLIYEDDAVEAFFLAASGNHTGIFNVAAGGTVTYPELARLMNKKIILLPFKMLAALAGFGKKLGISPVSGTTLQFIRHPIIIDGSKFSEQFDFVPQYDSRQAFLKFIQLL